MLSRGVVVTTGIFVGLEVPARLPVVITVLDGPPEPKDVPNVVRASDAHDVQQLRLAQDSHDPIPAPQLADIGRCRRHQVRFNSGAGFFGPPDEGAQERGAVDADRGDHDRYDPKRRDAHEERVHPTEGFAQELGRHLLTEQREERGEVAAEVVGEVVPALGWGTVGLRADSVYRRGHIEDECGGEEGVQEVAQWLAYGFGRLDIVGGGRDAQGCLPVLRRTDAEGL